MLQNRVNQYTVEIHKKYAIPFACIVFVLIAGPLAIRFPRGGVGMVIATSLTIFTVYYVGLISGESLGDRGIVPPFLGMWAPNFIFLGLAIWGLARVGHEDGSTRGGGWTDLVHAVLGVMTAPRRWLKLRRPGASPEAGEAVDTNEADAGRAAADGEPDRSQEERRPEPSVRGSAVLAGSGKGTSPNA
jgi:hypothetical protein